MALSDPFLLSSLSFALRESTYSWDKIKCYSIDISGLILIIEECDYTCVRDFLFLFDGKKLINSAIDISEVVLSKCFPENVQRITGFLVIIIAKALQCVPVLLFN